MAKRQILSDMFHIVITIVLLLHAIPCMADFKDVENLESGEYGLQMRKGDNGFFIVFTCSNEMVACMEKPAKITVRSQDTLSSGKYEVKEYACKYSSVAKTPDGLRAVACLTTEPGSVFIVEDIYKAYSDGTYLIDRTVRVEKSEDGDVGFSSELVVGSCLSGGGTEDYEYFIPSILYKDTSCMRKGAVASDMSVGNIYVKETRTGLPMIMLRHKATGHSMTLVHHKPCVSVGKNPGGGVHGEVNLQGV